MSFLEHAVDTITHSQRILEGLDVPFGDKAGEGGLELGVLQVQARRLEGRFGIFELGLEAVVVD